MANGNLINIIYIGIGSLDAVKLDTVKRKLYQNPIGCLDKSKRDKYLGG